MSTVYVYTHARTQWKGRPRPPLVLGYTRHQGQGACLHEVASGPWHRVCQAAVKEHREKCLAAEAAKA